MLTFEPARLDFGLEDRALSVTLHNTGGTMIVAAFLEGDDGELIESGYQVDEAFSSSFSFEALPGDNWLIAWSDENDSREIDEGDYLGFLPAPVDVAAGAEIGGVEIVLEPAQRVMARGAPSWRVIEAVIQRARGQPTR